MKEADQDGVDHSAFYDFPDCVEELNSCQWQVIYHGLQSDVLFVLKEPMFRTITLQMEGWVDLVKDLPDNMTLVEAVQSFAEEDACPELFHLVPPLESALQLRSLMYQRDLELARRVQESYLEKHTAVLEKHGLLSGLEQELRICGNLIRKADLEEELDQAIAHDPAQVYCYDGTNDQPAYKDLYDLTLSVQDLTDTLADLEELARAQPTPTPMLSKTFMDIASVPSAISMSPDSINDRRRSQSLTSIPEQGGIANADGPGASASAGAGDGAAGGDGAVASVKGTFHTSLEEKVGLTRVLRCARMNLMLAETGDPADVVSAVQALRAPSLYPPAKPSDSKDGQKEEKESGGGGREGQGSHSPNGSTRQNSRAARSSSRGGSIAGAAAAAAAAMSARASGSATTATSTGNQPPSGHSPHKPPSGHGHGHGHHRGSSRSRDPDVIRSTSGIPAPPQYIDWEAVLADFEAAVAESLLTSEMLPDYAVEEYEVIVGEFVRRSLVCGFQHILGTIAVLGEVDISVGVNQEELIDLFYRYNHFSRLMNPAFDEFPKNVQALARFTGSILRLRKHVLEDAWDQRIHVLIDSINNMEHGGGMLMPGLTQELLRVQEELKAREALLALKQALEDVRIIVPDKHTADVERMVDLQPLRKACEGIATNNGKHSKQLLTLANSMLSVMQALLAEDTIDQQKVDEAAAQYTAYHLDSTSVEAVFKYIRVHTFLKNLCDALEKNHSAESIMAALTQIKDSLKPIPQRFIPWLKASYIYCELVGAFATEDWIQIVESTRKLEECIETLSDVKITTEGEGHNEGFFLNLLRAKTANGYSTALRIKEAEELRRTQSDFENMTEEQMAKAKLRKEDELNQYGIAALRLAGYSDNEIVNVKFPVKYLWALDFDPVLLRKRGFQARKLLAAGYSVPALYFAGFGVDQLKKAGVAVEELRAAGVDLDQLKLAGYPEEDILLRGDLPRGFLRQSEYGANKLLKMGLAMKDLLTAGFSVMELRAVGFSALELKQTERVTIDELRAAGMTTDSTAQNNKIAGLILSCTFFVILII